MSTDLVSEPIFPFLLPKRMPTRISFRSAFHVLEILHLDTPNSLLIRILKRYAALAM